MTTKPNRHESRRRTARFLEFCAGGMRYDAAAELAGIWPGKALRLVSDPEFEQQVDAIRAALEEEAA